MHAKLAGLADATCPSGLGETRGTTGGDIGESLVNHGGFVAYPSECEGCLSAKVDCIRDSWCGRGRDALCLDNLGHVGVVGRAEERETGSVGVVQRHS